MLAAWRIRGESCKLYKRAAETARDGPPPQASGTGVGNVTAIEILWKDADPDIPLSRQAKAEYAALR